MQWFPDLKLCPYAHKAEKESNSFSVSGGYSVPVGDPDGHSGPSCFSEQLWQLCPSADAQALVHSSHKPPLYILQFPSGALKLDVIQTHTFQKDPKISHQEKALELFSSLFLLLNSIKKQPLTHPQPAPPNTAWIIIFYHLFFFSSLLYFSPSWKGKDDGTEYWREKHLF